MHQAIQQRGQYMNYNSNWLLLSNLYVFLYQAFLIGKKTSRSFFSLWCNNILMPNWCTMYEKDFKWIEISKTLLPTCLQIGFYLLTVNKIWTSHQSLNQFPSRMHFSNFGQPQKKRRTEESLKQSLYKLFLSYNSSIRSC